MNKQKLKQLIALSVELNRALTKATLKDDQLDLMSALADIDSFYVEVKYEGSKNAQDAKVRFLQGEGGRV